MSAFRRAGTLHRAGLATAATALVCATSFGLPAVAAAGTAPASSQDSSNCTKDSISKAADQSQVPWEIQAAAPNTLVNQHGTNLTGSNVNVAVIDTGIAEQGQLHVVGGEVLNGESGGDAADDDGHGTMVASIIAAQKGGNGMQGIAPGVNLYSFREAGCNAPQGDGNTEDAMATAINDAVRMHADVINISQDGYVDDANLSAAVKNAYENGVVIVTSAGNQGDRDTTDSSSADYGVNPKTYPASYAPYVLAVGAVDQYGTVPTFSETGTAKNGYYVGVVAPGVGVEGLLPAGTLAVDDGTSFAAPYVAAEAALIMQEHDWEGHSSGVANAARAYDVMKIIEATADGGGGYSAADGWGEVNIQAALSTPLTSGDSLVPDPGRIGGLPLLLGAGPDADGPASTSNTNSNRTVIKPYVAAAVNQEQQHQQRWAYIALGVGLLVALVALAGSFVARDTARRRGGGQSQS
jgi:subtilisin family serine protease